MTEAQIDVAGLREALGWTQQQLADYCGTDRSTVSKWEREAPAKGPALVLLRQLQLRLADQSQASTACDPHDFDASSRVNAAAGSVPSRPEPAASLEAVPP